MDIPREKAGRSSCPGRLSVSRKVVMMMVVVVKEAGVCWRSLPAESER